MIFITRSFFILLALYGVAFALGDAALSSANAPLWWAVGFAVGIIALQYLVAPLVISRLLRIEWITPAELPEPNRTFLLRLCSERGISVPRLGIIRSGTPNAFSFGYTPGRAQVVITQGLLDLLTPEEANAALAHEIGHVEHWDFLVITVAALVPLLLYQIYGYTRNASNHIRLVGLGAYLGYLATQWVVLLLNRTRESYADHYAALVTGTPNALSSALIKIAQGLVKSDGEARMAAKAHSQPARELRRHERLGDALALLGISNLRACTGLVLGSASPAAAARVMRWELVNPWARFYEWGSTHPLTSRRVQAMNQEAESLHQVGAFPLPTETPRRWGALAPEVAIWAAPWACVGAVLVWVWLPVFGLRLPAIPDAIEPTVMISGGLAWALRIWYRYRGGFAPASIVELLEDTDVSQMKARPVQLEGKILGKGEPGAFWSPDLVLRDASGILFVLNRRSVPFARLLFALTALQGYIGKAVVLEGWYRRGLMPYVEMGSIHCEGGPSSRSRSRQIQYCVAALLVAFGCWWLHLRLNHLPL